MRSLGVGLAVAYCLLLGAGDPLSAYQGPDYAKLKAFLPPGAGAALCFSRTYDASHLAAHPQQTVTALILSIRYVALSDDDAILIATDDGGTEKQTFRYDFTLAAKTRGRHETLYASGDCASAEGIGCDVECDGGGIDIEPFAGKNHSILVRLERIRMTLGCRDGPSVDLEGGLDDKVFKLMKAPRDLCKAMQARAEKSAE